jgi:hypothetical protein
MGRTTDLILRLRDIIAELRGIRKAVEASSPEMAARLGSHGAHDPWSGP